MFCKQYLFRYRMILEKKQQVSIAQLCQGCPSQFAEFLAYARSLKFDAKPDIPYLRKLFRDLYHAQGFAAGGGKVWDWDNLDPEFLSNGNIGGSGPPPQIMGGEEVSDKDAEVVGGGYERPTTAAAVASRPTSSWGFSSRVPPPEFDQSPQVPQLGAKQPVVMDRPHTASAAVSGGRPAPGGGGGALLDPHAMQQAQDVEGSGQVVASARALMRYSRTRTDGGSVEKSWNSGNPGDAAAAAPRITVYQNPSKAPQAQQQSTGGGGFLGSGWLGSDRPKSAGIATSGGILSAFTGNRAPVCIVIFIV
jgi:hypothetical protein